MQENSILDAGNWLQALRQSRDEITATFSRLSNRRPSLNLMFVLLQKPRCSSCLTIAYLAGKYTWIHGVSMKEKYLRLLVDVCTCAHECEGP